MKVEDCWDIFLSCKGQKEFFESYLRRKQGARGLIHSSRWKRQVSVFDAPNLATIAKSTLSLVLALSIGMNPDE